MDQRLKDKFEKNKFNVCSSASSSIVDDDLDTGKFFCTVLRGEELEVWPKHYYHLVFFDLKVKGVNMAWVVDREFEVIEGIQIIPDCHGAEVLSGVPSGWSLVVTRWWDGGVVVGGLYRPSTRKVSCSNRSIVLFHISLAVEWTVIARNAIR